jgi:hypothetical protein
VAVAALLILTIPIAQERSRSTLIGPRIYSFESESLIGSGDGWQNITYSGVTFGFHVWCGLPSPGGGEICGNASESSGVRYDYSFPDGPPSPNPAWQTWVAPDHHEAVQHRQRGLVHLLVAE